MVAAALCIVTWILLHPTQYISLWLPFRIYLFLEVLKLMLFGVLLSIDIIVKIQREFDPNVWWDVRAE